MLVTTVALVLKHFLIDKQTRLISPVTSNSKLTGTNSKFTKSFYKRPSSFLTGLSTFINIQLRIIFFMEHLMSKILENPKPIYDWKETDGRTVG